MDSIEVLLTNVFSFVGGGNDLLGLAIIVIVISLYFRFRKKKGGKSGVI